MSEAISTRPRAADVPFYSEENARGALDIRQAFDAIEQSFVVAHGQQASNFPVVRERLPEGRIFGIKSAFDGKAQVLALKAGGYWADNGSRGLTNHQSVTLLFDALTGRPKALVSANYLTAMRTAAAAAVSVAHLARTDARTLGIIGAGHQASYQIRACLGVRSFDRVLIWSRTTASALRLAASLTDLPVQVEVVTAESVCRNSDVLITITPASEPLVAAAWVRPGTHIAAMGADTAGKQELDPLLFARAIAFTDEIEQAATIGECQHALKLGVLAKGKIKSLGAVIAGAQEGRTDEATVTIFDGTGVALQDLAVATVVVGAQIK
jgi:alanine dehydrogenase